MQNKLDNLIETKKAIHSKKKLAKSVQKKSLPVAKEPVKLKRTKKVHYPRVNRTVETKKNRENNYIIKQEKQLQAELNRLEQKRIEVEKKYNNVLVKKATID